MWLLDKVLIAFLIGFHGVLLVIMVVILIISVTGLSNYLNSYKITNSWSTQEKKFICYNLFFRNHLECPVADCVCRCYSLDSTSRYCSV